MAFWLFRRKGKSNEAEDLAGFRSGASEATTAEGTGSSDETDSQALAEESVVGLAQVEKNSASDAENPQLRRARPAKKANKPSGSVTARIIAVVNQKGGVGKSTTTINLGACLAEKGKRVLLVDIDPQANATSGIGLGHLDDLSIYDVLVSGHPINETLLGTGHENLFVVPSSLQLAGAEIELVAAISRETRLQKALDTMRRDFDFILIDCPPSLGLLTVNGLTAADEVLVPIQCEYYALEGVSKLSETVSLIKANLNPRLRISGVLLTMYDARTRLSEQVASEVRKYFQDTVFKVVVPRSVRLAEAPSHGLPISAYDSSSPGADAYRGLAEEVIARG